MEEFDRDDLDNLVDGRMDEEVNEYLEQQDDDNPSEEIAEEKVVPVKVRVKKPQPKLDPER